MKLVYVFVALLGISLLFAFAKADKDTSFRQNSSEQEVKAVINTFFKGFHSQDSLLIKKVVHQDVIIQSIGKSKTGSVELSTQNFNNFLSSICSISDNTTFEERIHNYEIKMNGKMANVWAPYSFFINGNLSHCGINNFQLLKRNDVWKIFYIVDTREREGCSERRG